MNMDKLPLMLISFLLFFLTIFIFVSLSLPDSIKHKIKSISSSSSVKATIKAEVLEDIFSVLTSYNLKMSGNRDDEQYRGTLQQFKAKIKEYNLEKNIILRRGFKSTQGPWDLKQIEEYLNSNHIEIDHDTTMTLEIRNLNVIGEAHISFYKYSTDSGVSGPQLFHIKNSHFNSKLTIDALAPSVLNGNSFSELRMNYGIDVTLGDSELGAAISFLKDNYVSGDVNMFSYTLSQFIQDPYWKNIREKSKVDRLNNRRMRMHFKGNVIKGHAQFSLTNYGLGTLVFNSRNEIASIDITDTIFYKEKAIAFPLTTDLKGNIQEDIITEVKIGPEEVIPADSALYEQHRPLFLYLKKKAINTGDDFHEQVYDRTLRRLSYPADGNSDLSLLDKLDRSMYYGHSVLIPVLVLFTVMSLFSLIFSIFTHFEFSYVVTHYPQLFLRFLEVNWLDYKTLISPDVQITLMHSLTLQVIYVASRLLYYPIVTFGILRTIQRFF